MKTIITLLKGNSGNHFQYEKEDYDDITFDVIKRGPLLVLLIGLTFASLTLAIECLSRLNIHLKKLKNFFEKLYWHENFGS